MRHRQPARGFTVTEVLVVGLIALLLLLTLSELLPRFNNGLSSKVICSANLMGIGKGMATYASSNNNMWPVPAHLPAVADEVGRVRYAPGKIGTKRGSATQPDAGESTTSDDQLSPTRAFWALVRTGANSPKSLICPDSQDVPNQDDDPQSFWDAASYTEVSYGYQVPFGKHGQPGPNVDPAMALAADKGPYSYALETGKPGPGAPTVSVEASPADWRKYNSPNHGGEDKGEGQNVMYADAHVEYHTTPLAGVKKDNIYTRWSRADGGTDLDPAPRVQGTPPTGIETPWSDTDSLIYP
jgi:hypothetical protein